jgi:ABC-type enterobactin transport system permease subunit
VVLLSLPRIPADPILTGIGVAALLAGLVAWLIVTRRPER